MDDYRDHDVVSVWDVSTRQRLGGISGETSFHRILFSTDGTSILVNDTFAFGRIYLWSLPDEQALAARQALVAFTGALNDGDYEAAAALFHLFDEEREWYASMGLDTTSPLALFTSLCVLESQPCMPIEEVLYQGEQDDEIYTFLVRFSGPDGETYMNLDGDTVFWMYAMIDQDGSVRVTSLPPFDYNP
ncbi:MAG: hypothetical protein ABIJ39_12405 [Chloroflexota bacterium]